MTDDTPLSQDALRGLQHDVQRDAARTRAAENYSAMQQTEKDAEATEAQLEKGRHHDAF